jgi:6-pyruvoyltetrahydropterin/6-carboxytetrahydropterin synthase
MYQIVQELVFPYGHRLTHHPGGCGRLHGHNGQLQVVLEADTLDDQGYVMDFDALNDVLRTVLEETFDHRMILHKEDPIIPYLQDAGEEFVTLDQHPTAEAIARAVYDQLSDRGLPAVEVRLYETPTSLAVYRPGD